MARSTHTIPSPHGARFSIPVSVTDDIDPAFQFHELDAARDYYDDQSYVVFRGLVPEDTCDAARATFAEDVKPYPGFLYRQATARAQRHVFTAAGHMLNSLINIQDNRRPRLLGFREAVMAALTHERLTQAADALLGERGTIVQTMYFEGNPVTWAHQDSYYLDAETPGRMTAAWVALEDIHPGAGRFFVYPKSHEVKDAPSDGPMDVAYNHDRYKAWVLALIEANSLECRAPAIAKGNVLFWNSRTIHGSLETTEAQASRNSLTAHIIPQSQRFLQLRSRIRPLRLKSINGVRVHHPKDQEQLVNRLIFAFECHCPWLAYTMKDIAVKLLTR